MKTTKNNSRNVLLHLSLIGDVGPSTSLKILRYLFSQIFPDVLYVGWMEIIQHQDSIPFDLVYDLSISDLIRKAGLTEKQASDIFYGLAKNDVLLKEQDLAYKHGMNIISLMDDEYPEILKQIPQPPLVLYISGAGLVPSTKYIGFVGSRKASEYAQHAIEHLVPDLVGNGWSIVSGGALGADTMAHVATLDAGGVTVAVLGSGLLQPYPESNKNLFARIIAHNGSVISPFSLNTHPDKSTFPARNRIISGLSLGCVIVQAAQRSGALITAHCALEQGRQVFAIPGLINDVLSAGCHQLIQQGAKLVNNVQDILEEFGENRMQMTVLPVFREGILRDAANAAPQDERRGNGLHQETNIVLAKLDQASTLDELLETTGLEAEDLQQRLFMLQVDGRVRQNFAGTWEKI